MDNKKLITIISLGIVVFLGLSLWLVLGSKENLLLTLTYIPLGESNRQPSGEQFSSSQSAIFKIHLISTNLAEGALMQILQPRYLTFSDPSQFVKKVETLSIIAPPTGTVRQEQILLPISADSSIDRIRIERYSGSAILIDASIFRMGHP